MKIFPMSFDLAAQPALGLRRSSGDGVGIPGCIRAEAQWIGSDTDPRQVKAVGVPAGPDGYIIVLVSVCVACNGVGQQGELAVIEIDMECTDRARKLGGALSMHGIPAVALTARVMKEGKVFYDAPVRPVVPGKMQAVAPDARPVRSPVQALPFEAERPAQGGDEPGCDRQGAISEARIRRMRRVSGLPAGGSA
jgi:hypothetical protein